MLHKFPMLARIVAVLIVGLYIFGLYYIYTNFITPPNSRGLLNFSQASSSGRILPNSTTQQRIFLTTDGGKSWSVAFNLKNRYLTALTCAAPESCFATGMNFDLNNDQSTISNPYLFLATQDSGKSWTTTPLKLAQIGAENDTESDYYSQDYISCPTKNTCFLLGEDEEGSVVSSTNDGGKNWITRPTGASYGDLYALNCPGERLCYVAGRDGLIMNTSDGGQSWAKQKSSTESSLIGLKCGSPQFCLATGRNNLIVATNDGGQSWAKKSGTTIRGTPSLSCPGENICYLYGYSTSGSARVILTKDGGTSWKTLDIGTKETLSGFSCADTTNCYAMTHSGLLKTTNDGGETWTNLNDSTATNFTAFSCPAKNVCYAMTYPDTKL